MTFDEIKHKASGFGAALVVIGALFKIQHWPGASLMLILGLSTEAIIFILSAIAKPGKSYAWEKVYPELGELKNKRPINKAKINAVSKNQQNVIKGLEDIPLLDESAISSLKGSIENLGKTTKNMGDVTSVTKNLSEYSNQIEQNTSNLSAINAAYEVQLQQSKESYDVSSQIVESLKQGVENSSKISNSLSELNKNVQSLSSIYGGMLSAVKK